MSNIFLQTQYTYDNNDRLSQQGGTTYTHDNNGSTLNETLDGNSKSYTYNAKNQLIETSNAGVTTSYQYNSDGIRTAQTTGLETTGYVVDSNRAYAQVIEERLNNTTTVSYTYGDDLLSQTRNGTTNTYHYDGLGSTRALSDNTDAMTDTYFYEAFGEVLYQTGVTINDYLFAGEQFDSNLGQYYLRARYYDQGIGRFTQMDTWMGNNSGPVTLHKYLYGNADPAGFVDPSGNFGVSLSGVMSAVNISSTLAVTSAGLSGYSIGSGSVAIYEGRYRDGAKDIAFGFMGTGVAVGGYKLIKFTFGPVNNAIRNKYLSFLSTEMPAQIALWKRQRKTSELIAKSIIIMRNSIKVETRAMMAADGLAGKFMKKVLELRNLKKYKHPLGPDLKFYLNGKNKKSFEGIIESALRSSEKINRMFGGTL